MEFLKLMEDWDGFVAAGKKKFTEAQIAKAVDLISNKAGYSMRKHALMMEEAITTTDFPDLFGFIIDREVLARYKVAPMDWKAYFKMKPVVNFNTLEVHKVTGSDDRLPAVTEKGEYLVSPVSEGHYEWKVAKYGKQFDISWEAIINDVLGAFSDIPERFANAAIRSENFAATSLYASAGGPDAALFGAAVVDAADGAAILNLGVLALTIANLETTLGLMAAQLDVNGEPLSIRGKHLVVPPQLEMTARAILSSATVIGTAAVPFPTLNVIPQLGLQLHVDPYLPVIDTTDAHETWYVFADPSEGAALGWSYLRGHESPEICMHASDKVSVAGAPLSPFSGDFATDNIFYRVRHVFGGGRMDPRMCYAQVGP